MKMEYPIDVNASIARERRRFGLPAIGPSGWLIVVIGLGLTGLLIWAANSQIDQMVRARGQVIAEARTQVIQAADNGVLAEMRVTEGQQVRQGDLLALMDQNRVSAALDDSQNKVAALKATLARLRAEVYGGSLSFPPELDGWPSFRENQTQLYYRRRQALNEGISALRQSRALVQDELNITEPLLAAGDVGQVDVIRLRRSIADLDGQIVNLRNKYFQDAQQEMTKAEEELATQEEMLRERSVVYDFTELRAPHDGQIKKIVTTTIGASLRAGEPVLEILPTASDLIVEAKFKPSDLSDVRVGQTALIKLDAYDPSIYGSLEGEVAYISPDTLTERGPQGQEEVFYRVQIRLPEQPAPPPGRKAINVDAGMTATVEVRTKQRSVLTFLTKPITKTIDDAFGER
ncbi:HlyD family efflux transporter periplasmic adaptor subunit [Aurantiacibacter suaedae]|uniref:HlyD family efflux transporter periplasmic adaptor subunit n=1 Tax=Aurantiacibacter suaedae TaxID=2545755 RepID=UPI0010F8F492|nr:HlyD family efflux transporter periplasmic adaptor subunit [Aurantiacibacter suaedae]